MKRGISLFLIGTVLLSFVLQGCYKKPLYYPLKKAKRISAAPEKAGKAMAETLAMDSRIETDLIRYRAYSAAMSEMASEMFELRKISKVYSRDYYEPREHDKIENLLFRYLMCRGSLWEFVRYYVNYRQIYSDPVLQTKAFLIGYGAGLQVVNYSSLIVATFLNEPVGIAKINEAFPRSEIPRGTYDMLYKQVTSVQNLKSIKVAWVLFSNEMKDSSSVLNHLYVRDPECRKIVDDIHRLYKESNERIETILKDKSLLLPEVVNQLRQNMIAEIADKAKMAVNDNLYAAREVLFTTVGDIKAPTAKPLHFSPEQKKLVKSLLRPGDIILTYSAGYMSNIFLPGHFKHGIVYVGSPAQRQGMGLTEAKVRDCAPLPSETMYPYLARERLPNGYEADVIEAVSEGVVFNSMDFLMDSHINRMVILRPQLEAEELVGALSHTYSLLNNPYDFKFDFNDGACECCTEIIYRSLHLRGRFNFSLTKRAGVFTLSADDIVNYYLRVKPDSFIFVLFADKDPDDKGNNAILHTDAAGEEYFKQFITKGK